MKKRYQVAVALRSLGDGATCITVSAHRDNRLRWAEVESIGGCTVAKRVIFIDRKVVYCLCIEVVLSGLLHIRYLIMRSGLVVRCFR